jgi:hypothetical protein
MVDASIPDTKLWTWISQPPADLRTCRTVRAARSDHAWTSTVMLVEDPTTKRRWIDKRRRLLPTELLEIDVVLARLADKDIPALPSITGWCVADHHLRLLLEPVGGVHACREPWRERLDDPRGSGATARLALNLVCTLRELHSADLIYQDLTARQLISVEPMRLADLDTIVLRAGLCARLGSWLPAGAPTKGCSELTDTYLAAYIINDLGNSPTLAPSERASVHEAKNALLTKDPETGLRLAADTLARVAA